MSPSQKNFHSAMFRLGIPLYSHSETVQKQLYEAYVAGWEQNVIHDPAEEAKERKEYREQVAFTIAATLINLVLVVAWYLG